MSYSCASGEGLQVLGDADINPGVWTRSAACWIKILSMTAGIPVMMWGSSGASGMYVYGSSTVFANRMSGGLEDSSTNHTLGYSDVLGKWCLFVQTCTGDASGYTEHSLYIAELGGAAPTAANNGKKTVTETVSYASIGDRFRLNRNYFGGTGAAGKYAYCCTWDIALSDPDVASLMTQTPDNVQAGNIIEYWPLDNNTTGLTGAQGAANLTSTGTYDADMPTFSGASAVAGISRHYARMMTA